jgi:hypothetical protein
MKSYKAFFVIILPLYLLLGLAYCYYTPLWSPPDEELHFAYCEFISINQKFPTLQPSTENYRVSQAFHPPLYYLIGSFFCRYYGKPITQLVTVNDGPGYRIIQHPEGETTTKRSAYFLRIFTLLLSAATIYIIYLMTLMIFPDDVATAATAVFFTGLNPQFIHIASSVSNETLAVTLSTLYIFLLLRYSTRHYHYKQIFLMGALLGGCLLTKTSTIFLIPVTACIVAWRRFRDIKKLLVELVIVFAAATIVSGWWYIKSWGFLSNLQTAQPWFLRQSPLSLGYLWMVISRTFTSFFGDFGALQIPVFSEHLLFYGGLLLCGFAGLFWLLIKKQLKKYQHVMLAVLGLSFVCGIAVFIMLNYKYYAFLGRYLFIVIAPIAIGTCIGIRSLVPYRFKNLSMLAFSFLLIAVNLDIFFRVLKPAYADTCLMADINQPMFSYPTQEINVSTTIGQTFRAEGNNLCAIRAMLFRGANQEVADITFSLSEEGNKDNVLRQIKMPLVKISTDISRYFFVFPPINNSMGKEYIFSFSSSSLPSKNGVSLWYEPTDIYSSGRMFVNGEAACGDLYFTTYCFPGGTPKTDWQGRRNTVISQDQYVSVRERQLYYERSKAFRVRTVTHEKMSRLDRALKNLASLSKNIN